VNIGVVCGYCVGATFVSAWPYFAEYYPRVCSIACDITEEWSGAPLLKKAEVIAEEQVQLVIGLALLFMVVI